MHLVAMVVFWISLILTVIGGLNWGVVAITNGKESLLHWLGIKDATANRIIYGVYGVAAVLLILSAGYLAVTREPFVGELTVVRAPALGVGRVSMRGLGVGGVQGISGLRRA